MDKCYIDDLIKEGNRKRRVDSLTNVVGNVSICGLILATVLVGYTNREKIANTIKSSIDRYRFLYFTPTIKYFWQEGDRYVNFGRLEGLNDRQVEEYRDVMIYINRKPDFIMNKDGKEIERIREDEEIFVIDANKNGVVDKIKN